MLAFLRLLSFSCQFFTRSSPFKYLILAPETPPFVLINTGGLLDSFDIFRALDKRGYHNNSIYWDPVCIGTPFVLEKIIILTIILIGTY